jgi:hypothetical protein
MRFCTYWYLRRDGTPYYIGKGSENRPYCSQRITHRPKEDSRIFIQYWGSETEAFEMEKYYIKLFGRKDIKSGILRNFTDGGDGAAGTIRSLQTREKISESKTGVPRAPFSEEWRKNLSLSLQGNTRCRGKHWNLTLEQRQNHSKSLKGKSKVGAALVASKKNGCLGGGHARWHSNKGIFNSECYKCQQERTLILCP